MTISSNSSTLRGSLAIGFWLILTVGVANCLLAGEATTNRSTVAKVQPSEESSPEVAALRAQLELMRQYDQRLLNTVYWALGTVVFVALLLSGYSWYANFRVYQRDRANLRDELRLLVQKEMLIVGKTLEDSAAKNYQDLSAAQSEFLKSVPGQYEAIRKSSREVVEAAEAGLKYLIINLRLELLELKIDHQKITKTNPSTLLKSHIDMLELGLELDRSFVYVDALKAIEGLMKSGGKLWHDDVTKLHGLLGRLPKEFAMQADLIRHLVPASIREPL